MTMSESMQDYSAHAGWFEGPPICCKYQRVTQIQGD